MNLGALAYPDTFVISGVEHKGKRDKNGEVRIPYTTEPDIGIGDDITQKSGSQLIQLKVIDVSFLREGTLRLGTRHPHQLTLFVENTTAAAHKNSAQSSVYHIGSIAGEQVQVGNHNSQVVTINIQQLTDAIAKSPDPEAKGLLRQLLENGTVGSIIGAGTTALLALLT